MKLCAKLLLFSDSLSIVADIEDSRRAGKASSHVIGPDGKTPIRRTLLYKILSDRASGRDFRSNMSHKNRLTRISNVSDITNQMNIKLENNSLLHNKYSCSPK